MLKKHFGKILIFILNLFLLVAGVFFIKNREENKVAKENSDVSDAVTNGVVESPAEAEPVATTENLSQFPLPSQDNSVAPIESATTVAKPAPVSTTTSPSPTTTTKKPKTKTS